MRNIFFTIYNNKISLIILDNKIYERLNLYKFFFAKIVCPILELTVKDAVA